MNANLREFVQQIANLDEERQVFVISLYRQLSEKYIRFRLADLLVATVYSLIDGTELCSSGCVVLISLVRAGFISLGAASTAISPVSLRDVTEASRLIEAISCSPCYNVQVFSQISQTLSRDQQLKAIISLPRPKGRPTPSSALSALTFMKLKQFPINEVENEIPSAVFAEISSLTSVPYKGTEPGVKPIQESNVSALEPVDPVEFRRLISSVVRSGSSELDITQSILNLKLPKWSEADVCATLLAIASDQPWQPLFLEVFTHLLTSRQRILWHNAFDFCVIIALQPSLGEPDGESAVCPADTWSPERAERFGRLIGELMVRQVLSLEVLAGLTVSEDMTPGQAAVLASVLTTATAKWRNGEAGLLSLLRQPGLCQVRESLFAGRSEWVSQFYNVIGLTLFSEEAHPTAAEETQGNKGLCLWDQLS